MNLVKLAKNSRVVATLLATKQAVRGIGRITKGLKTQASLLILNIPALSIVLKKE